MVESAGTVIGVEAKSGATVGSDFLDHLRRFTQRVEEHHPELRASSRLLYGGEREERRTHAHVVPWQRIQEVEW
ncbi:MAG: hypothetical protein WEA24_10110 [Gemmatimonadota bacterium]